MVVVIIGKSDNYRQATRAGSGCNPGDPPADKDPLKAENPRLYSNMVFFGEFKNTGVHSPCVAKFSFLLPKSCSFNHLVPKNKSLMRIMLIVHRYLQNLEWMSPNVVGQLHHSLTLTHNYSL